MASASILSAQENCKQIYQNECTVSATFLSPFLTELENSGLGRTSEGQTEKSAAKNIWWFLQWRIKNKLKSEAAHA